MKALLSFAKLLRVVEKVLGSELMLCRRWLSDDLDCRRYFLNGLLFGVKIGDRLMVGMLSLVMFDVSSERLFVVEM